MFTFLKLNSKLGIPFTKIASNIRFFSSEKEDQIAKILRDKLKTEKVVVEDVSGGCGAMYKIEVHSKSFQGKSLVQQHREVQDILKDEIKSMHGLTLTTKAIQ